VDGKVIRLTPGDNEYEEIKNYCPVNKNKKQKFESDQKVMSNFKNFEFSEWPSKDKYRLSTEEFYSPSEDSSFKKKTWKERVNQNPSEVIKEFKNNLSLKLEPSEQAFSTFHSRRKSKHSNYSYINQNMDTIRQKLSDLGSLKGNEIETKKKLKMVINSVNRYVPIKVHHGDERSGYKRSKINNYSAIQDNWKDRNMRKSDQMLEEDLQNSIKEKRIILDKL